MSLWMQGSVGSLMFLGLAWGASEARGAVRWRIPIAGLGLQFALALLLLRVPPAQALDEATKEGTRFVFGYLGGGEPPFEMTDPGKLYILAFRGLPLVLVMSALSALLFYWRRWPGAWACPGRRPWPAASSWASRWCSTSWWPISS